MRGNHEVDPGMPCLWAPQTEVTQLLRESGRPPLDRHQSRRCGEWLGDPLRVAGQTTRRRPIRRGVCSGFTLLLVEPKVELEPATLGLRSRAGGGSTGNPRQFRLQLSEGLLAPGPSTA